MTCSVSNVSVELKNIGQSEETLISKYAQDMIATIEDVKLRAGKQGEFLNWIGELPKIQLENIDKTFSLVEEAKKGGYENLVIIGIGGSRHTTEALTRMLDYDNGLIFCCAADQPSLRRLEKKIGNSLDKTKFLVVSKSGGTLEPSVGYDYFRKVVEAKYGKEDAKNHFVAMTDASNKSKLRQKVEAGEIILSGLVHDDVGGRFSIFDDATLFTLAFQGMSKEEMKELMSASKNAQEQFLSTDLKDNIAAKQAIFNVACKEAGKLIHHIDLFGDAFEFETLWEQQAKNESIKANYYSVAGASPAKYHHESEGDLHPDNDYSFYSIVNVKPEKDDYKFKALVDGIKTAYSNQHPVSCIELSDYSPTTIAQLVELKHFETLYSGALIRRIQGDVTPKSEALAEVLQPNVETYKKEVNKNIAEFEANM